MHIQYSDSDIVPAFQTSQVPTLNTGRERTLSWVFEKPGQDSSQLMNLVNLPMKNATATKKLLKQKVPTKQAREADELKKKVAASVSALPSLSHDGDGQAGNAKKRELESDFEPGEDQDDQGLADQGGGDGKRSKVAKLAHKKNAFSGYSPAEKEAYSFVVTGEEDGDTRNCTALDEALQALKFACYHLEKQESSAKSVPPMLTASFEPLVTPTRLASFSFCIGIFLEFLFQGKVCVNGKDCRAYSTLRVELQNILIKSNESFSVEVTETSTDEKGKKPSAKAKRTHTALELAELLCSAYMDLPATSVDFGDEDEELDQEETHANVWDWGCTGLIFCLLNPLYATKLEASNSLNNPDHA